MFQILIVDDEELAVNRLKRMLSAYREIGEIATFLNPRDAYEYAGQHAVDIAFLDISMPDVNGMKLSGLLKSIHPSIDIVFVTGFDQYAVKAFEMNALDYVMKPVTAKRLCATVEKIKRMRRLSVEEPALEIMLFNGLTINLPDRERKTAIKLRSPKTEELFAFLVCKRTVTREEIADTLWSGLEPDKAWKNLNSNLYYIRKAIEFDKNWSGIVTGGHNLRFEAEGIYCDLYDFERMLKEVRRDPEGSAHLLERAEALYTGPLLKGKAYEWAVEFARSLEQQYIELLDLSARHYRRRGHHMQALHCCNEILKLDSIREDIHAEAIRILIELGRKNEALRQYRDLEAMMLRELKARPDPALWNMLQ